MTYLFTPQWIIYTWQWSLVFCISICASNAHAQNLQPKKITIPMGQDSVQLHIYNVPGEQISYVHIHENETTSLSAGLNVLQKHGGTLVTLVHSFDGTKYRNVSFRLQNTTYFFDPNRIYTADDAVLRRSIKIKNGKGMVDKKVISIVRNLADRIWYEVALHPLIVALHNNKNEPVSYKTKWLFWSSVEPESYNVTSYVKKYDKEDDSNLSCSDIYINPKYNNSEFFIVTQRRDFSLFYKRRASVVLQNENPIDDGSMSVFAVKNNKRYINAEAKHGRVKEQTEMLGLLHDF